ncbi:MAG: VWA domain-containing protein [Clostridia bacterium]|nr:VWA domain-containing protein [Clostridia bacterium]
MKISRIISLILALMLCVGSLVSCFDGIGGEEQKPSTEGEGAEKPSEGLDYALINSDEEYAVSGMGECRDKKVIVPEEHEGKPVTEIAERAFAGNPDIISIKLPATIVKVGDKAFSDCVQLESVTMPDAVQVGTDVYRGSINVVINVNHNLIYVAAKEATCEEAGNKAHYYCEACDEYYTDKNGQNKMYDVQIPASHNFVDGYCDKCGTVLDSVNIVSVDAVPALGKFALGTLESAIGLPAEINVYTADGTKHQLPISWDLSGYNKAVAGQYTIKGHVQAGKLRFAEGVSSAVEASIEIVEYMKGTADIVFVLDVSASMGEYIANVKNNLSSFAQAIENEGVSARWGIITYSDYVDVPGDSKEETQVIKNGASDWYVTASEAASAIGKIQLAYGGDAPECGVDGLLLANTLSTRQDARVFYILLTDIDSKVNNHYGVGSMQECSDILAANGVNVSVVCPTGYYSHYSCFTSTGGVQINISNDSFATNLKDALVPIIYEDVVN